MWTTLIAVGLVLKVLGLVSGDSQVNQAPAPVLSLPSVNPTISAPTEEITPTVKPSPKPTIFPTKYPTSVPTVFKAITPKPTVKIYTPPAPPVDQPITGSYPCSCSKTCSEMSSCHEAGGCTARDADHDGVACDAQCQ